VDRVVELPRRVRASLFLFAAAWPALAGAQSPPAPGTPYPGPCVQVEVAGRKAGHLDCATQRLAAAARAAQASARAAFDTPVIDARAPDVRTGVASQSATRQRMGNALGTSVHPQRPVSRP
jgi:hypothetical protein